MKKINSVLVPIITLSQTPLMMASPLTSCGSKNSWRLTNPDDSLTVDIKLNNQGSLTYSVEKNNKQIVDASILGMSFKNGNKVYDFSKGLTFVKATTDEKEFSYDCPTGKTSHVDVHYKEKVITTKIDDLFMDVTFRALNDGYGFQYSFRSEDENLTSLQWTNEFSEFNIPSDSITYGMDYEANRVGQIDYYSYETHYDIRDFKDIDPIKIVSMPFGYETNGYYSLVTESGLIGSGYHGSFLQKDENDILATVHAPASGKEPDYSVSLPFTSPWRVSSVGSYATAFETTIVEDIQGDIEEYVPKGETKADYSWVEPGLTAWSWLQQPTKDSDITTQREYIKLASAMGWKYTLWDATWENMGDEDTQKGLVEEAHNSGVKVLVWADAMKEFANKDKMIETLDWYKRIGVDGIKVDFWDGQAESPTRLSHQMEDKQTIQQYDEFYKLAAKYHMVVNCHGCNKPTGERRKYPNIINREGIRGNEMHNVYSGQGVLHTLTRGVVGPSDFTPVVKPLEHDVTIGYQMALPILLESGIPSMADWPATYIDTSTEPATDTAYTDYYKHLPASWDQSKFIQGNPEKYVVVARRKGNNWWLAGVTTSQRTINIDFSFLDNGTYDAVIYNGGSRGEHDIEKTTDTIARDSKKIISVTDNGGFVIELTKK